MPWEPRGEAVLDLRIAPYRDRAAALLLNGQQVGLLYAEWTQGVMQTGGHLWWRTLLPPVDTLELHIRIGDLDLLDCWVGNDLDADLADWARGVLTCDDVEYECRWLDDIASADVRRELGIPPLSPE